MGIKLMYGCASDVEMATDLNSELFENPISGFRKVVALRQ